MKLINMTPHKVTIRKKDGSEVSIEPSGKVFRLEERDEVIGEIDGIEVVKREFTLSELPSEFDDDDAVILVSLPALLALRAAQIKTKATILAPDTGSGAIRDAEGRIVGTKRLIAM